MATDPKKPILRPKRGKRSTAIDQNIKLARGEIFFEVPDTGTGTGVGNIVMGDGTSNYEDLPYFVKGSGGGGGQGTVSSVNYVYPDATGNIKLDSVPLAENLISSDNLVLTDKYIFRTSGNHTDISSGYATLNIIKGNCVYNSESNTITVATPSKFKSVELNQFNKDVDIISDFTINAQGNFVPLIGSSICIIKSIGGLDTGYVAYSKSGTINRIGWSDVYPTVSSSIYVTVDGTYVTSLSLGAITSSIVTTTNGYICIATTDKDALCVHPRWSGNADTQFAEYDEDIITIPIADKDGLALPTASYGFPSVNSVADEIDFAKQKYTQRIGHYSYTPANLSIVEAMGVDYIFDATHIFYVLKTPTVYTLGTGYNPIYMVNDYGTEEFVGTSIPITAQHIYGQNLKDKLRRDVVTISNQTLSMNEQKQIRINIDAFGATASFLEADDMSTTKLLNLMVPGELINTVFGAIKRLLRKLSKKVDAKVSTVNANLPDPFGNIEITRVPLADNLYSSDNTEVYGSFLIRTTGGNNDVHSGPAQIDYIRGNVEIEGRSEEHLAINASSTHVPEPGEIYIPISASISSSVWRASRYGAESGVYMFIYDGSNWTYNSLTVDLTSVGITVEGSIFASDIVTVDYTKKEQGTIYIAKPEKFTSTGLNIFNKNNTTNIIENATIDLSGNIKAATNSWVIMVHVPYANDRGYVAYSSEYAITRIGFSTVKPAIGDAVSLSGAALGAQLSVYMVPEEGWLCVSTTDMDTLCVHPRWSGENDLVYAPYTETTITLPTTDREGTNLPLATYGMPSIEGVRDELNLDLKRYIQRIGVEPYSDEKLAEIEAAGYLHDYDETYILYALPMFKSYYLDSSISGVYTAHDYGLEEFSGGSVTVYTDNLYGDNLKDKLKRDVVTISAQNLTTAQQKQVRENIGAAPAVTYGDTDLTEGTSTLSYGTLYFFSDGTNKKVYIGDTNDKAKLIF